MTRRALAAAGLLLALALAGGAILLLHPPCLILKYSGFYCTGCGTQRMVWALLRGDFPGAARQNLFMLVFLPIFSFYMVAEALRYVKGRPLLLRSKGFPAAACLVLAAAGVFTVLRNLPSFSWLAPVGSVFVG